MKIRFSMVRMVTLIPSAFALAYGSGVMEAINNMPSILIHNREDRFKRINLRLESQIGSGAMGDVFKGYRYINGNKMTPVAVKCNVLESREVQDNIEVNIIKKLSHPNIVQSYGSFKTGFKNVSKDMEAFNFSIFDVISGQFHVFNTIREVGEFLYPKINQLPRVERSIQSETAIPIHLLEYSLDATMFAESKKSRRMQIDMLVSAIQKCTMRDFCAYLAGEVRNYHAKVWTPRLDALCEQVGLSCLTYSWVCNVFTEVKIVEGILTECMDAALSDYLLRFRSRPPLFNPKTKAKDIAKKTKESSSKTKLKTTEEKDSSEYTNKCTNTSKRASSKNEVAFESTKEARSSQVRYREIFRQILEGLKFLHDNGIVHRDIKLNNFLVSLDSENKEIVKLCDFGSAFYENGNSPPYKSNWINSAPEYIMFALKDANLKKMGKDQKCVRRYSSKIDVWGAGVVFFEAVTGITPFLIRNKVEGSLRAIQENPLDHNPDFFKKFGFTVYKRKKTPILAKYSHLFDPLFIDLFSNMTKIDPSERYTIDQCLNHPYFQEK